MDYAGGVVNKFYKQENYNYEHEKLKFEILLLEKELKENFNINEFYVFAEYKKKILELKKVQDLELVGFALKEFLNDKQ